MPKAASDIVGYKGPKSNSSDVASIEIRDSGAPAPTFQSTPTSTPTPTSTSSPTSPPSDEDPFLAFHQMPPDEVVRTMRAALAKVQACFRAGLERDPSASGEVKIRFVVENDGKPIAWRDEGSSMSDEDVTKCIGERIQTLRFPKQKAPGRAFGIYSIHLSP